MIMLAVPPLVRLMVCNPLLPTRTFPKFTAEGLAVSCPCTPVPLSGIVVGDPGALLLMLILPNALPVEVGANWAVKEVLAPALIVCGTLRPLMLNPVPETVA